MSRSSSASMMTPFPSTKPKDYKHSPIHYAVVLGDNFTLTRLVSTLPKLANPAHIHSECDSLSQERIADQISAVIDRRDVPFSEIPLHLAVLLNDSVAARTLAAAGADVSLQNAAAWNPLQGALCRQSSDIALLRNSVRREIAPSDTYKIWKRDGNLRADTSLAGFDGLKIQRADQSFLFLGDGDHNHNIPCGSLLVLNHDDCKIFDAFENAGVPMCESDITGFCSQTSVYRPGIDITRAELLQIKKSRKFRKRYAGSEQMLPLELDENEDGFLVCENPNFGMPDRRRHGNFVREDREWILVGRKSVDVVFLLQLRLPEDRQASNGLASAAAPFLKTKGNKTCNSGRPNSKGGDYLHKICCQSTDQVYTPLSSPGPLSQAAEGLKSDNKRNPSSVSMSSSWSSTAWLSGYTWTTVDDKPSQLKKSK
ncbi:arogenate dehydratase/prephenate dehydratase 1 [Hibiscus syriacus]|uniref:Arogenate dehydratase/prephenate dehydratase 1 n=1 Tax=Hibiscus syriacus TaxID=106335 RepID=A0A6A2WDT6_HIBSY|nr:arogenate dehydratase/prephenate dehydratase 1 [Hibiscus syriacus]